MSGHVNPTPGRDILIGRNLEDCQYWALRLRDAGIPVPERDWFTPSTPARLDGLRPRSVYVTPEAHLAHDWSKLIHSVERARRKMHHTSVGAITQLRAPSGHPEAL